MLGCSKEVLYRSLFKAQEISCFVWEQVEGRVDEIKKVMSRNVDKDMKNISG